MLKSLSQPKIVMLKLGQVQPYPNNPRDHPRAQIEMLKASIAKYGFNAPILVTPDYQLIAGHGRVTAALELGLEEVPCIVLGHLSEAEQRAYRIADNAIALKGEWSIELLSEEVAYLVENEFDVGLELGFETGEFDFLVETEGRKKRSKVEVAPPEPTRSTPAVSRRGDIWTSSHHRIMCGDATCEDDFKRLFGNERADVVISDMPYNLRINGHVSGLGKVEHAEFPMASGEMSKEEFRAFTQIVFEHQAAFSKAGALNYQFIDWRSVSDMISVGLLVYDKLVNLCVWVKPQGSMGSLYRSRHELVCVFRTGGARHDNFVQLGKHGRNRTNVWEYASPSGFGPERQNLKFHPTCKNLDMIADAIMDCTRRKGIVFDAFLGSGTSVLAAHRTGRRGRGLELDPYYVDLAVARLVEATGDVAIDQSGRTFEAVRELRLLGVE